MTDDLLSPKLKIERAKTLIKEMEGRIDEYLSTVKCDLVISRHPNIEWQSIAWVRVGSPVPQEIALIAGDAVHNLRTALDHLAACLSVKNGKSRKGVYFPFAEDRDGFKASAPEKIKKIAPRARAQIYRLKPYGGGNDFLCLLNKFDLQDKHRVLSLCTTILGKIGGTFSCDKPIQVSSPITGSLHEGVHLFTFPSDAKFEHQLKLIFGIRLEKTADLDGAEREPISTILHQFVDLVERIVGIFERRFFL